MESQDLINKIKSIDVIKNLFNYVQDNNFLLKLIIYSKSLQKIKNRNIRL